MNMELTSQVLAARQEQTRVSAQITMIRKQREMEMMLLETMDKAAQNTPSPPPPGMGTKIDKSA